MIQLIGTALMCVGLGVILVATIPTGGARPGREEWRGAVKHHAWQPWHADQPRNVDSPPPGLSIEDSLTLLALAKLMLSWPAQDRWQSAGLVRPYITARHAAEQVSA